jgi:ABC-type multidrug transport system ATPase subunit
LALAPVLQVTDLKKSFKGLVALDNLSFEVHKGDIYGFLGQNGAGKSTAMRIILGLIFPDSGIVHIKGNRIDQFNRKELKHVGTIIERPDMYTTLSGWENLSMFASLSGVDVSQNRLKEVIEIVGLRGREHDKVSHYSLGMKQRLGIAIAIAHQPELLILDEPTNGLDPQGIAEIRALISYLGRECGNTIIVSSHMLSEIEQIANRMLIIHKGKKIVEGVVAELLKPEETLVAVTVNDCSLVIPKIRESQWSAYLQSFTADTFTLKLNPATVRELNRWLVHHDVDVYGITAMHSLENYFLNMTSHATDKN